MNCSMEDTTAPVALFPRGLGTRKARRQSRSSLALPLAAGCLLHFTFLRAARLFALRLGRQLLARLSLESFPLCAVRDVLCIHVESEPFDHFGCLFSSESAKSVDNLLPRHRHFGHEHSWGGNGAPKLQVYSHHRDSLEHLQP